MLSTRWLWITIPVAVICLVAVPVIAWRLYVAQRDSVRITLPLVAQQDFEIPQAGAMLLHAEGPRFTTKFGGLDYRLFDVARDRAVPLAAVLFRQSSSGLKQSRLSLRAFEITDPGRYRLTVTGLGTEPLAAGHGLVIGLDQRKGLVAHIVALVFASIALLAGVTMSCIIYFSNR